jgi:hypothetical protein
MDDSALFESELTTTTLGGVEKKKYLLKKQFQDAVLEEAKRVVSRVAQHKNIAKAALMGSILTKHLGKYASINGQRSEYSDIDLFLLLNCKLNDFNLEEAGLVKKRYTVQKNGKPETYYRVSVSDGKGNRLLILDRFSIDLWLITPGTYDDTMKRCPDLLKGAIEIK